jgi:hypothetical protein
MSATGRYLFSSPAIVNQPAVGTFGVAEYRAYTVGHDGRFAGFEAFVCADDHEAIGKAERLLDGQDIELWSGPRLVKRLSPKPRKK